MGTRTKFYCDIMALNPEVTGSCILVIVKYPNGTKTKFLVDCGLFQESKYDECNEKLPVIPEEVSFTLITHNHVDHTGRLPLLTKMGYNNPIYMTTGTEKFISAALYDSCKVLTDVAKRNNKKALYSSEDVYNTLNLIKDIECYKKFKIDEHISATFITNGHLIGAACILLQIHYPGYKNINLLFTGDYNSKNMFFKVPKIPKSIRNLDISIITESTYGDMESNEIISNFKNNVINAVNNEKTVIIPVFSLGRAQEIMSELSKWQKLEILNKKIPIYLDGKLAIKYTGIYLKKELNLYEEMKEFLPSNLQYVNENSRKDLLKNKKCKIILTTSGMGTYCPAQVYIPEYIQRQNALIHFTGYVAEGTLGEKLKSAKDGEIVQVGGMMAIKKADVQYTTEYSAHAKANELIDFLNLFPNKKMILITHGEKEIKNIFAERVLKETDCKKIGILGNEYFFRLDAYGLVKSLGTKFE